MSNHPAYDFAMRMFEVREAFKSIVDAIKNAGNVDNLGARQLRVLLDTVKGAADHAERYLDELEYLEWEKATHGDNDTD